MNKKLLILSVFVILIALLALPVSAAEATPTYMFDFSNKTYVDSIAAANWRNCTGVFDETDNVTVITASTGDPRVELLTTTPFNAADSKFIKVRFKTTVTNASIEFFFKSSTSPAYSGGDTTHFQFNITASEDWQEKIFQIPAAVTEWSGTISEVRFDYLQGDSVRAVEAGDEFTCAYLAFFKTEADAKSFRASSDNPPATTDADMTTDGGNQNTTEIAETSDSEALFMLTALIIIALPVVCMMKKSKIRI